MGEHQAITALEWGITREAQDELAASSHQKLAAAYERGFFDDLMTPFLGLNRDNNLRADSTVEKLAKLKPVFGKGETATMTAGNSTPLTDGASVVLLASEEWAKENGHEVLAYLSFSETAAVDFIGKNGPKEGLLMALLMRCLACLSVQTLNFKTSISMKSMKHSHLKCYLL